MLVLMRPRAVAHLRSRPFSTSSIRIAARRSQTFNSGFTSSYDPSADLGRGPIFAHTNKFGVPQFYPRDLKKRVDDYVVGQDRAKKTICSVIFNHYQALRRRQQFELQDQHLREKLQRQKYQQDREAFERAGFNGSTPVHPVEDEFPGHHESVRGTYEIPEDRERFDAPSDSFYVQEEPLATPEHVKIDKSNLLLIGPTGVGKTYIFETISKKINAPFTICDCNSFTQAGYIGQDVESCIERLLIEANYDIKAAEQGIIVLDEFDKIARKETVNGRDVGGEGVQQALLKLVEGTKVTITVKDNRSSRTLNNAPPGPGSPNPYGSPPASSGPPTKADQYTIDTTNILFVFCGAFVGLEKTVLRRVSRPSIGFGNEVRGRASSMSNLKDILPPEVYSHLPHQPIFSEGISGGSSGFTPLDLTTPADLQAFGFIPELIGRMHNICALSPLSLEELYRILTEPRNSLVAQYTALFETYPSKLYFTRLALYAIAERAAKNETGARGLKMEMERVLAEPMYDAPMSYVLITEACVHGTEKAAYWGKDGRFELERRIKEEDERIVGEVGGDDFQQVREAVGGP